MDLNTFSLPIRTYNALRRAHINTVEDLLALTDEELMEISNFGQKALEDVYSLKRTLSEHGLMQVPHHTRKDRTTSLSLLPPVIDLANELGLSLGSISQKTDFSWTNLLAEGNSWSQVKLFDETLEDRGLLCLEPLPVSPLIPLSSIQFLLKLGCPLSDIPAIRVALSDLEMHLLKEIKITTVLELFLISQNNTEITPPSWDINASSWERLKSSIEYYAEWLGHQIDWNNEVENNPPNPVALNQLRNLSFDELLNELFSGVDKRNLDIVLEHHGILEDFNKTLQEIGDQLGLSRERIRQLESSTLRKLRKNIQRSILLRTFVKILEITANTHIVINSTKLGVAVKRYFDRIEEIDLSRLAAFFLMEVLEETSAVTHRISEDIWVSVNLDGEMVSKTIASILQQLKSNMAPMQLDEISSVLMQSTEIPVEWAGNKQFLSACLEADETFQLIDNDYWGLVSWSRHLYDDVVMALRALARPAHYTEITQIINAKRELIDEPISDRNVHAQLGRYTNLFVRTGAGTFTLRELRPEAPTNPPKYIDLMEQVLQEARTTLSAQIIFERVNAIRPARLSSIIMYLDLNPRFAKYGNHIYGLAAWSPNNEPQPSVSSDDWLEEIKRAAFKELNKGSED